MKNPLSDEMVEIRSVGSVNVKHDVPKFVLYEHQRKAMECLDRINKIQSHGGKR